MRKYFDKLFGLATTGTAKDTYVLFVGNVISSFLGFLFTVIIARAISVAEFGIFSAVINLVNILASLSDVGISSGAVNFVSEHLGKHDENKANEYIKASFVIRLIIVLVISVVVLIFSGLISRLLLASDNPTMGIWAAVIPVFWFPDLFFPYILQAKRKFLHSVVYDNLFYLGRLIPVAIYYAYGMLTVNKAFWAFGAGFLTTVVLTFIYVKTDFYKSKPDKAVYKNLLKFSGWIAVNRIISSISGRLDIQMLAAMVGAVATGLYSIPARLATFIIALAGSYSSVLATRMASFGNFDEEKKYLIKSTIALIPISAGIVFWIVIAHPFIVILFGQKYEASVPIFQMLAASQIPFLFTVPAVTAIIYAIKRTFYIGIFSFFQIIAIFLLNYIFIPKYGPIGPTLTFSITNVILLIYTWSIVIKHYWRKK